MREFKDIFKKDFNNKNEFSLADFFNENTELSKKDISSHFQRIATYYDFKKENLKIAEDKFPFAKKISLTNIKTKLFSSFKKVLNNRRSRRIFSDKKISLSEISSLLKLSYGKIEVDGHPFSTIPSAGAIFPLHLYLLSENTELTKGVYHYHYVNNYLNQVLVDIGIKEKVEDSVVLKNLDSFPSLLFVITADLRDICTKYGDRGYRFSLIESGHLGQNLLLSAEYYNMNAVALGGFFDKELASLIKVNYEFEKPLYVIAMGKK